MAKKTKLPLESTFSSITLTTFFYFSISVVICLSDDDDGNNNKTNIPIPTPIKQTEPSTIVTTNNSSGWNIDEKDIIHISELPSKYSDIFKNPFEIRCSAIRFGIVEFNVESEVVLMHPTEFEMKLTGK
jgi:hypothetical protein